MRIVGVIDLRGGRAVHAQGGCRHGYRPVERVDGVDVHGDPVAVARVYVEQLGVAEIYVADLDAIAGGTPQREVTRTIAAIGARLWLDAGIATIAQAARAATSGAARIIVGLETLPSMATLRAIADETRPSRAVFSLDLRDGVPIASAEPLCALTPPELARRAVDAGAGAIIVLDLARVGSGRGLDLHLLQTIRDAVPDVPLLAGGGVRHNGDLEALAAAGCDGALVATALHAGVLHG
jgi:phosphoribosylformimino-5-aminoimidazole carboxamide ribotide isomerase